VNLSFGGEVTHDGQLGKPSHQLNRSLNLMSTSGHTDIILFAMKVFSAKRASQENCSFLASLDCKSTLIRTVFPRYGEPLLLIQLD
jgi:hypothetical protein